MQWYEEEVRQLERKAATRSDRPKVAFYGSSTFTRWGTALEQCFPQIQAVNLGFGGSTLAACAWFFDRVIPRQRPDYLMIYAGDNDLGDGRNSEEVVLFYEQLLARSRTALGNIPVCFVSIKPSLARQHLRGNIEYTNDCIRQRIARYGTPLYYLDLYRHMIDERGQPQPALFEADGLHLSPQGYALWQREIGAQLDCMLFQHEPA